MHIITANTTHVIKRHFNKNDLNQQMLINLAVEGRSLPLIHHESDESDIRNEKSLVAIK